MVRTSCLVALIGLLVSCHGPAASTAPRAQQPSPAAPASATSPPAPPRAAPWPALPPSAVARLPEVAIESPASEQVIELGGAARLGVRVRLEPAAWELCLLLDDGPPRCARRGEPMLVLGRLALTPESLGPGPHVLAAFARGPDGRIARDASGTAAVTAVRFWIGERPVEPPPASPQVVLNSPAGTYYDTAADALVLDWALAFAELAPDRFRVEASLSSDDGSTTSGVLTSPGATLALGAFPSGDYRVDLRLYGASDDTGSTPGITAARAFTVNRELSAAPRP